jgi:hypothetical protein
MPARERGGRESLPFLTHLLCDSCNHLADPGGKHGRVYDGNSYDCGV